MYIYLHGYIFYMYIDICMYIIMNNVLHKTHACQIIAIGLRTNWHTSSSMKFRVAQNLAFGSDQGLWIIVY